MGESWGQKKWLAVAGDGDPLGVGGKRAAVEEAVEYAADHGGEAWIEEADASHQEANPRGDGGIEAYWQTGLQSICLAKYGTRGSPDFWQEGLDHLTADLVESISLMDAMRRIRPYMPPSKDYDAKWESLPSGTPGDSGYGILAKNAKLAKDESPDGIPGKCFGLVLAPHRVGLRVFGKPSPSGFAIDASKVNTQAGKDVLFSAKPDSGDGLSVWSGVNFKSHAGSIKGARSRAPVVAPKAPTVCFRASGGDLGCMAACLVHSGQNPASDEALVSKLALTAALYHDPAAFCRYLLACLRRFFAQGDCDKADYYVRLNVFSDIPWEWLFPDLIDPIKLLAMRDFDTEGKQFRAPFRKGGEIHREGAWRKRPVVGLGSFYDYTKVPHRMQAFGEYIAAEHDKVDLHEATELCRAYYHLTFSYSGVKTNIREAQQILEQGDNVAVVFVLEQGEWEDEEFYSEGVATAAVDNKHVKARFADYRPDKDMVTALKAAWVYALTGEYTKTLVGVAKRLEIEPPHGGRKPQRVEYALDVVQRLTGDDTLTEDVLWRTFSPAESKQLRGRYKKGAKGMALPAGVDPAKRHRYEEGWIYPFTFMGYPVINADRNDIRAKDPKAFPGPHIVGLDFKVPKIKTKVEQWQVYRRVPTGKKKKLAWVKMGESFVFDTPEEAAKVARGPLWEVHKRLKRGWAGRGVYTTLAQARTAASGMAGEVEIEEMTAPTRFTQVGILTSPRVDIDKSAFVTAVRETPGGMLIATQTPNQTPGTRGERP